MAGSQPIQITVNDQCYELSVEPRRTLLQVLRHDLRLTGTKAGCEQGECGSCTVIMDGVAVNSCLVLAVEAAGSQILTIEGFSRGEQLTPLQEAFTQWGAVQCGFCTPGMIMTAKSLLDRDVEISEEKIRQGLSGNLCRCTGYHSIINAILAASQKVGLEPQMAKRAGTGEPVPAGSFPASGKGARGGSV